MGFTSLQYQEMLARTERNMRRTPRLEDQEAPERESAIHKFILSECRRRGWICFHGSMAHRTHRTVGEPDFVILASEGRLFLIECKRKGGKQSTAQLALTAMAHHLGHIMHVVTTPREFLNICDPETSQA